MMLSLDFAVGVSSRLEMLKGNFGFIEVEVWYKFGPGDVAGDKLDNSDSCLHPIEHGAEDGPLRLSL